MIPTRNAACKLLETEYKFPLCACCIPMTTGISPWGDADMMLDPKSTVEIAFSHVCHDLTCRQEMAPTGTNQSLRRNDEAVESTPETYASSYISSVVFFQTIIPAKMAATYTSMEYMIQIPAHTT